MAQKNANWVIGNWKMQPVSQSEVTSLLTALTTKLPKDITTLPNIAIAPSFLHLAIVEPLIQDSMIQLTAQDLCGQHASHGAYTGEVSAKQLIDIGVNSVIVGHSERRQYLGENNECLSQKIACALSQGLIVILCVGETLAQYEAKQTQNVIAAQLEVLQPFLKDVFKDKIIIAYEPVWAIGTGKVPTVTEVTDVHHYIANRILSVNSNFDKTPILYGGSVKAENAKDFAQSPAVSGVLVGGASLDAESFWQIIQAFA